MIIFDFIGILQKNKNQYPISEKRVDYPTLKPFSDLLFLLLDRFQCIDRGKTDKNHHDHPSGCHP